MQIFDTIVGLAKKLTEVGVALIALAIVAQVLFGTEAAFKMFFSLLQIVPQTSNR